MCFIWNVSQKTVLKTDYKIAKYVKEKKKNLNWHFKDTESHSMRLAILMQNKNCSSQL